MEKGKIKNAVLSKKVGWTIIIFLVLLDAILDIKGGGKGNLLWQPIMDLLGITNSFILIPIALFFLYLIVKLGAWLTRKVDKVKEKSEELVLTALVLAYAVFDIWVILVKFFGFNLIKSHYQLAPVLIVIVLVYSVWAERKLKKQK